MGRSISTQKLPLLVGRSQPVYLPYPWTQPIHHPKRHPDPISCFSTIHWTNRPTGRQTDRPTDGPCDKTCINDSDAANNDNAAAADDDDDDDDDVGTWISSA